MELPYGTIYVLNKANVGWSYGGYSFAFDKFDYDWWLFTEEDVFIGGEDYYKKIIEKFNSVENCGFVGVVGCHEGDYPAHCDGGMGLTSKKVLTKVKKKIGYLPHLTHTGFTPKDIRYEVIRYGEIPFTNEIHKLGFKLVPYTKEGRWGFEHNFCNPYMLFKK
jgi:hypothetical protein